MPVLITARDKRASGSISSRGGIGNPGHTPGTGWARIPNVSLQQGAEIQHPAPTHTAVLPLPILPPPLVHLVTVATGYQQDREKWEGVGACSMLAAEDSQCAGAADKASLPFVLSGAGLQACAASSPPAGRHLHCGLVSCKKCPV